jgi:hypothetical protein
MNMVKIFMTFTIAAFAVVNSMSQPVAAPAASAKETIHGTIIDNACATGHKDSLATFIKSHTKECTLMPACEASGYSIYTNDGKLHPFLHSNTAMIAEYLKVKTHTLHAVVTAEIVGDSLKLEKIQSAKIPVKPTEKSKTRGHESD